VASKELQTRFAHPSPILKACKAFENEGGYFLQALKASVNPIEGVPADSNKSCVSLLGQKNKAPHWELRFKGGVQCFPSQSSNSLC
jgi:hypothetical protein